MGRIKTAVILAAGMGSRLQDITQNKVPKGLIKVNGKTLVERSIEKLRSLGIDKIYIVTGHLSESYDELAKKNKYIKTIKNRKYKATGSMTSLSILEHELKEDFLLLESDLIYEVYGLIKVINFEQDDCVLLSGRTNSGDECYVEIRDDNLYKISKHKEEIENVYGELVGISKISIELYKEMLKQYKNFNIETMEYGQRTKKYDYENAMFDAAKNRKIGYLKIENLIWGEIDDKNHLNRIEKTILPRLEKVNKVRSGL
ncbi:phosphocholine cytidylyltransferase family protein [Clostridium saccharobutylicum]|uniref:Putative sugar nucleotidyltransferase n=1 Tax=Clostridium saccharobutylicum DSM 13864 TaxID=1345695 RepID=U5MMV8_CLOSA|nr:phosphocholine cytidylyltransferase family protein [Clostridium saccharobutylicum]AGX41885.1 putative sugar nucleotidyltransferase [Clostridium saccharobutylicum DSM 13864]AQR89160.1 bifunctional IPC transferase and DIPP synthase [Clostridium saccharobutylicum]AQR99061.1 bifunctional IPC transferase and DIPP synthase [Clostridium saccharobutylicum]AQS13049.1 bifunctional IPC transferase and DIPP synthase [Clostridium saccharobutylicum]MBA2903830.1 choline kinase [Clostridium saccharobutylic